MFNLTFKNFAVKLKTVCYDGFMPKEIPEFKPISKEERDRMEGVTPVQKDAIKHGLQTTWEETLEELESKAQEILPSEPPTPKKPSEQKETAHESVLEKLKDGLSALLLEEKDLVRQINEKIAETENCFSEEILKAVVGLRRIMLTLDNFYANGKISRNTDLAIFERMNETLKTRNFLMREALLQAKNRKEKEDKGTE